MNDLVQPRLRLSESLCDHPDAGVYVGPPVALDRLELRLEIGKAVRAMQEAHHKAFHDPDAEAELQKATQDWREAQQKEREASKRVDDLRARMARGNLKEQQAVLKLESSTPGLLLMSNEYLPAGYPSVMVCALTGLAIFEGDEIVGNEDYGFVALKNAIEPKPGIPSLGPDPRDME